MKSKFNYRNSGFTIIELLIFITINGLLASVTLPKFLSQAQKAKQTEAKTFVGTMNRAQQAYYLEHNVFTIQANFKDLGIGKQAQTENYRYTIAGGGRGTSVVTNQAVLRNVRSPLKAYIGGVSATLYPGTSNIITQSILCEAAKSAAYGGVSTGIVKYSAISLPSCPVNMIVIK